MQMACENLSYIFVYGFPSLNFRFQSIYFITRASVCVSVFPLFCVDERASERMRLFEKKWARADRDLSFIPLKID